MQETIFETAEKSLFSAWYPARTGKEDETQVRSEKEGFESPSFLSHAGSSRRQENAHRNLYRTTQKKRRTTLPTTSHSGTLHTGMPAKVSSVVTESGLYTTQGRSLIYTPWEYQTAGLSNVGVSNVGVSNCRSIKRGSIKLGILLDPQSSYNQ